MPVHDIDVASCETEGLSAADLRRIAALVYEQVGIRLGPEKKTMLEGRLRRRIRQLDLSSYREYCRYLFEGPGKNSDEVTHLIDVVTTNKTEFFRERAHFDLLASEAIPGLRAQFGAHREMLIWSAGCSTGEEPYTLAMVLAECARENAGLQFRILATDISTVVLAKARQGIYIEEAASGVPPDLQRRYLMRSRDRESRLMRVVPELRERIEFRRLNLMEDFQISEPVHIIFCRNVVIYFDQPTQERLFCRLAERLAPGGYIFLGHSESLHHMNTPLIPVAPAVYRKKHAGHVH